MFQKFFTKTIESKFIKNLLYNTALPIYKTVRNGDYVFKDNIYIFNDTLIKCTKSGYLGTTSWHVNNVDSAFSYSQASEKINYIKYIYDEEGAVIETKNLIQYADTIRPSVDGFVLVEPTTYEITAETTLDMLKDMLTNKYYLVVEDAEEVYYIDEVCGFQSSNAYANIQNIKAVKGNYVCDINSTNSLLYPIDGRQGIYWYEIDNNSPIVAEYVINTYNYEFGKMYDAFTERYISEFGYYDSGTHEQLGRYLRCIRDLYNLDLMPFYNCYSNRTARNFYIKKSHITYEDEEGTKLGEIPYYELINASNSDYKVLQVPIKFNKTYTIAIDASSEVWVIPAVIKNERPVTVYNSSKQKIDLTKELNKNVLVKQGTQFKHPFTYRIDLTDTTENAKYLAINENNLYLLIQLPKTNSSSIVVLESDGNSAGYTKAGITKYYENDAFDSFSEQQRDYLFLSMLSLLKINDKVNYAFSDRLIEYLTLNVITPLDKIDTNIEYVQELLGLDNVYQSSSGVWSDSIRKYCYANIMGDNKIEHYDLNGYVDKNVEKNCRNIDWTYKEEENGN